MDQNRISDVFVSKFTINGHILYAKVIWKQNDNELFRIKLYDQETTWTGTFSNDNASKCRKITHETEEQYQRNVRNALTASESMYTYELTQEHDNSKPNSFQWLKKYEDGALMSHGSVLLDETAESKNELIEILLQQNKHLQCSIEGLNDNNKQILQDLDKCKSELESFVNVKASLESTLYGKFAHVLNTKKKRIQLLEESLLKFEETKKNICDNMD